ncbi:MAG: hypothetical protein HC904_13045 [Blastochloris sp.]|nr:hypothetical protein [Blastochloris sp.]
MHATEYWQKMSPEKNHEILEFAYLNDKKLYRRVVEDLSAQLRKRPKLILETPRAQRHELFRPLLGLPNVHLLSQNLMILWLGQKQVTLLNAFLDALGIEHDQAGSVERFPETVDKKKLSSAVEGLYQAFPEEDVNAYLSVFDSISGVNWPELKDLIRVDAATTSPA